MNEMNDLRFKGIGSLLGEDNLQKLSEAHFCVIGLGGVGTWAVESLARSGVGKLTLVDLDDICVSNTNRQLHALDGSYGNMKAEELRDRVLKINPNCEVIVKLNYFNEKNCEDILGAKPDVVVDCIDSARDKCLLFYECYKREIKLVSTGAAGGKSDPTKITVADLSKTRDDMLLKRIRKLLRREYHYPLGRRGGRVKCVFSTEIAKEVEVCETGVNTSGAKLDCEGSLGSITYITGTFGFFVSHLAISEYLNQAN